MKALVHTKPFVMEYRDVPKSECMDNEVIVKIASVGICGSDVYGFTGKTGRRIPPIIMGHEAAGEIVEVADNSIYMIGDRVTFDSTIYCGKCKYCVDGKVNLCSDRKVLGVSCNEYIQNGAMSEYISIPERIIYKLEENIDYNDAALIEPASVAYHAISMVNVHQGEQVMVVGAGVIGLIIIQALKIFGCENIIAVDIDKKRLEIAEYYGANVVIHSKKSDPLLYIRKNFDNKIDVVFEAVGKEETVYLAVESTRKRGRIILIGNITPDALIPLQKVVTMELNIIGSCASAGEYPLIIKDLSDLKLDFKKIITTKAPLEEGEKWFKILHEGNSNEIKVVLNP